MSEIIFVVEKAVESGFTARALGHSIFAEGDDLISLRPSVQDAVRCHFEESERPKIIRLRYVKEELISAS